MCPFGGVETLFSLIAGAGFIEKTAASAVVLFVGMLGMALVMRRSFCGQICPLGALQGVFGSIGGKLFRRRLEIPKAIDRPARFLKYGVLAFFSVWTWQAASLVMRPYDPWVAYAHVTSAELFAEFGIGVAILGVSLAGSLVYERFFCKYLCPTGAVLGLVSKVSLFGIKRDEDACINCSACDKACPMNIEVSTAQTVTSSECISCNECVNACPAAGALEVERGQGSKRNPTLVTGVVVGLHRSGDRREHGSRRICLADAERLARRSSSSASRVAPSRAHPSIPASSKATCAARLVSGHCRGFPDSWEPLSGQQGLLRLGRH